MGIVPVANLKTDYQFPTPSYIMPIAKNFVAVQKAVIECAIAGCSTIWIVANQDTAPILKKVIGEYTYDPIYYNVDFGSPFVSDKRHEIPIYYTGIRDKDRHRRDSYGWSAIHGIHSAWWVSYKISKWIIPEKYFISFPMGIHDWKVTRKHRKIIGDRDNNYFATYNGKTVKDNLPLSFTMRKEDFIECRRHVNKLTTKEYYPPAEGEEMPSKRLSAEERWSARRFDFSIVYEKTKEEGAIRHELEWFFDISKWGEYTEYMGSEHTIEIPIKALTKSRKHAKLFQ